MKKILIVAAALALVGCDQYVTRTFGGETKLEIPSGTQLVSMTWKGTDLWYLYYNPETNRCVFQESSAVGMMEGSVVIQNCNPVMFHEKTMGD